MERWSQLSLSAIAIGSGSVYSFGLTQWKLTEYCLALMAKVVYHVRKSLLVCGRALSGTGSVCYHTRPIICEKCEIMLEELLKSGFT